MCVHLFRNFLNPTCCFSINKIWNTSYQSICAVVRSTPTDCAGVHTVCGEGAEGYSIEWVVSVRAGKYQVYGVWKFVQMKKPTIHISLERKPLIACYDVLFKFYNQFRCDLTPHTYIIWSFLFLWSLWSVQMWVRQNF